MSADTSRTKGAKPVELGEVLERNQYCYLTTTGRVTGRPHRIEIWFAIVEGSLFVNSGGGANSDWVKNLIADPELIVEVGDDRWKGVATIRSEATEHPARERLAERYQGWSPGRQLSAWATGGLLVEIRPTELS